MSTRPKRNQFSRIGISDLVYMRWSVSICVRRTWIRIRGFEQGRKGEMFLGWEGVCCNLRSNWPDLGGQQRQKARMAGDPGRPRRTGVAALDCPYAGAASQNSQINETLEKGRGDYLVRFDPPNTIVQEPPWSPREGPLRDRWPKNGEGPLRDRSPKNAACGGSEQQWSHTSEKGIGTLCCCLWAMRNSV